MIYKLMLQKFNLSIEPPFYFIIPYMYLQFNKYSINEKAAQLIN